MPAGAVAAVVVGWDVVAAAAAAVGFFGGWLREAALTIAVRVAAAGAVVLLAPLLHPC